MPPPHEFDIGITLSDAAMGRPSPAPPASGPSGESGGDEFDLDFKYLGGDGTQPDPSWMPTVPSPNALMAVGSGVFGITCSCTCSHTCAVLVGGGNTCAATCSHTCHVIVSCPCGGGDNDDDNDDEDDNDDDDDDEVQ